MTNSGWPLKEQPSIASWLTVAIPCRSNSKWLHRSMVMWPSPDQWDLRGSCPEAYEKDFSPQEKIKGKWQFLHLEVECGEWENPHVEVDGTEKWKNPGSYCHGWVSAVINPACARPFNFVLCELVNAVLLKLRLVSLMSCREHPSQLTAFTNYQTYNRRRILDQVLVGISKETKCLYFLWWNYILVDKIYLQVQIENFCSTPCAHVQSTTA